VVKEGRVEEHIPVRVQLTIPYRDDLLMLARLVAAATASVAGFNVEEVEDLRLAVYECCLRLGVGASDGALALSFELQDDAIAVDLDLQATAELPSFGDSDQVEVTLSEQIVDALVDSVELSFDGPRRHARLVSRRNSLIHEQ
jgi:serine/threonine-protein kinase RsbW